MKTLKILLERNLIIAWIIKFITNNPFYKKGLIIGSSVVIAQLISAASLPIITRIYSPSDLGVLGVYASTLTIITVIASFRYEFAYPLPKKDETAINLFALCLIILTVTSIAFTLVILFAEDILINNFHLYAIELYFWLLIPGFIGMGLYTILNFWAVRQRDYQRIAATRINQSACGAVCKIFLGFFSFGPFGLIIGHIVTQVAGVGTLFRAMWKVDQNKLEKISLIGIKSVAKEFKSFPLFALPQQILSALSLQLPALLLLAMYDTQTVGLYSLAFNLLVFPAFFISYSLSQVFSGEIAKMIREDVLGLRAFYLKTVKHLCIIAIPFIGGIAMIAPFIIPIFFGKVWSDAGWYCIPLALMVIPQFIVEPTSRLPFYGYNHWMLIWDIIRVSLVIIGFYLCQIFKFSVMSTLTIYAIVISVMYLILAFLNLKAISNFTSGGDKQKEN